MNRFFYTDGIHIFGQEPDEGFELSFLENPTCFMMTAERYESVKQRIVKNPRFAERVDKVLELLGKKVIVISEKSIPREKTQWELPNEIEAQVKKRIIESSPDYQDKKDSGFILPSGELGEDQSGAKVMTYVWHPKPNA